MKKNLKHLAWAFLALPLAFSCGGGNDQSKKEETSKVVRDTVKQCYTASFEGDSAVLNIKVIDSIDVVGDLVVNYAEKPGNNGIVRGKFKGDTLYVDYSFKTGNSPTEFSNPLVFLKKENNLKMGVGVIETAYGRSYFAKDKPINFERGKFDFAPADCK